MSAEKPMVIKKDCHCPKCDGKHSEQVEKTGCTECGGTTCCKKKK